MKTANQLYKDTKLSWSECLKKSWAAYRLRRDMMKSSVIFKYRKLDGSVRMALGTLSNIRAITAGRGGKPSYRTMTYFDVMKNEFRCFRIENLMEAM